ncbi:MAG: NADH:ubiquinone oxidoreductase, partial [Planctomycetes bacterium]|nr:NADH:ubiquinone oxidoreductase [Planctomycetota bacterium]
MKRTVIPVGPFHPIQEEPEFFQLTVEGERVVDVDVRISYNHRGIERLCQDLTYDQIPFILARICGICSASHPMAFCQACEDLCGAEVPIRGRHLRTIICELERIHSHLLWVGLAGHFIGYNTVFMWAWKYREPVLDLLEELVGNRNNYENFASGGCRRDIPQEMMPEIIKVLDGVQGPTEMLTNAVLDDPVLKVRLGGVGTLTYEDAVKWCTTGPTARGSGVPIDVRRDEPYASYDLINWQVHTQPQGDVFARAVVRLLETLEAIKILRECVEQIEPGEWRAEIREMPEGEGIGHAEAPRGETFHYVCSDGTNYPIRYKVRAPTYVNLPSFRASVIGEELADAMLTVASMDP